MTPTLATILIFAALWLLAAVIAIAAQHESISNNRNDP